MTDQRRERLRALKFVLFSASAGVIQAVSCTLLMELAHLRYWIAYLIALVLSVVYNFTVNRKFTFHSAANVPVAMFKVFLYYCAFTPLSTYGGKYLTERVGWNEYLVLALSMALNLITEYLFTRYVVYGRQVDNDGSAACGSQTDPQRSPARPERD